MKQVIRLRFAYKRRINFAPSPAAMGEGASDPVHLLFHRGSFVSPGLWIDAIKAS